MNDAMDPMRRSTAPGSASSAGKTSTGARATLRASDVLQHAPEANLPPSAYRWTYQWTDSSPEATLPPCAYPYQWTDGSIPLQASPPLAHLLDDPRTPLEFRWSFTHMKDAVELFWEGIKHT